MSYEDFKKAVEMFGIISNMSRKDIKNRYKKEKARGRIVYRKLLY